MKGITAAEIVVFSTEKSMSGEIKRFIFLLMFVFGMMGLARSLLVWRCDDIFWGSVILVALVFIQYLRGDKYPPQDG